MNVRRFIGALALTGTLLVAWGTASPQLALAQSDISTGTANQPLPVRLVIPAIHVDAAVEHVSNDANGAMEVPEEWADVGWYALGFRPGDRGNAVMAGHLDSTTDRAVFWDLNRLRVGDNVQVQDDDGSQLTFAVVSTELYAFDSAPLQKIFGPTDIPGLNLVTCNGTFDWGSGNYDKRLVVYTQQLAGEP